MGTSFEGRDRVPGFHKKIETAPQSNAPKAVEAMNTAESYAEVHATGALLSLGDPLYLYDHVETRAAAFLLLVCKRCIIELERKSVVRAKRSRAATEVHVQRKRRVVRAKRSECVL